jgi:hypothetical protein
MYLLQLEVQVGLANRDRPMLDVPVHSTDTCQWNNN